MKSVYAGLDSSGGSLRAKLLRLYGKKMLKLLGLADRHVDYVLVISNEMKAEEKHIFREKSLHCLSGKRM